MVNVLHVPPWRHFILHLPRGSADCTDGRCRCNCDVGPFAQTLPVKMRSRCAVSKTKAVNLILIFDPARVGPIDDARPGLRCVTWFTIDSRNTGVPTRVRDAKDQRPCYAGIDSLRECRLETAPFGYARRVRQSSGPSNMTASSRAGPLHSRNRSRTGD